MQQKAESFSLLVTWLLAAKCTQKICEFESKPCNIYYNCNRYNYNLSGKKTEVCLSNNFFLNRTYMHS